MSVVRLLLMFVCVGLCGAKTDWGSEIQDLHAQYTDPHQMFPKRVQTATSKDDGSEPSSCNCSHQKQECSHPYLMRFVKYFLRHLKEQENNEYSAQFVLNSSAYEELQAFANGGETISLHNLDITLTKLRVEKPAAAIVMSSGSPEWLTVCVAVVTTAAAIFIGAKIVTIRIQLTLFNVVLCIVVIGVLMSINSTYQNLLQRKRSAHLAKVHQMDKIPAACNKMSMTFWESSRHLFRVDLLGYQDECEEYYTEMGREPENEVTILEATVATFVNSFRSLPEFFGQAYNDFIRPIPYLWRLPALLLVAFFFYVICSSAFRYPLWLPSLTRRAAEIREPQEQTTPSLPNYVFNIYNQVSPLGVETIAQPSAEAPTNIRVQRSPLTIHSQQTGQVQNALVQTDEILPALVSSTSSSVPRSESQQTLYVQTAECLPVATSSPNVLSTTSPEDCKKEETCHSCRGVCQRNAIRDYFKNQKSGPVVEDLDSKTEDCNLSGDTRRRDDDCT